MRSPCTLLLFSLVGTLAVHPADLLPPHARGGELYAELEASRVSDLAVLRERLGLPAGWSPNATAVYRPAHLSNNASTAAFATMWPQRFFYDTTFCGDACFSANVPIVCEVSGEWTVSSAPGGAVAELAESLGALMVNLEHRFYGASMPTPISDRASMQAFLSVEEAIGDFSSFVPYLESSFGGSSSATQTTPYTPTRKWVIAGGSYAGALVTWITVAHGDLVTATWASSGVANATFDFYGFDEVVGEAVGPDCADALRAVTSAFEDAWVHNNTALLALYNATTAGLTYGDFAWALADSAGMAPQYGAKALLCSYLNATARDTPDAPLPFPAGFYFRGWDALVAFARWTSARYGPSFFSGCYYSSSCIANGPVSAWNDGVTWVWQCCSQLAYWNTASRFPTRSTALTTEYFTTQCDGAYTSPPDSEHAVAAFNARYGGATPFTAPTSRVFATQGSDDPWARAGVQQTLSTNYLESTATCAGCSHCRDLRTSNPVTDPPALTAQRTAVLAQLKAWVTAQPPPAPSAASSGLSPGVTAAITISVLGAAAAGVIGVRRYLQRRGAGKGASSGSSGDYAAV